MHNFNLNNILYLVMIVAFLYIIIKIFSGPIKLAIKLLINACFGIILLYVYNMYLSSGVGVILKLNAFNIIVSAILGVPGVILLILINFFA